MSAVKTMHFMVGTCYTDKEDIRGESRKQYGTKKLIKGKNQFAGYIGSGIYTAADRIADIDSYQPSGRLF